MNQSAKPARTAVPRRQTLVPEPLGLRPEPVPLLTTVDTSLSACALVPGASKSRPQPGLDETVAGWTTMLTAGGTTALFTREAVDDTHDASVSWAPRRRNLGVHGLAFAAVIDRVDFGPRRG